MSGCPSTPTPVWIILLHQHLHAFNRVWPKVHSCLLMDGFAFWLDFAATLPAVAFALNRPPSLPPFLWCLSSLLLVTSLQNPRWLRHHWGSFVCSVAAPCAHGCICYCLNFLAQRHVMFLLALYWQNLKLCINLMLTLLKQHLCPCMPSCSNVFALPLALPFHGILCLPSCHMPWAPMLQA